MPIYAPQACFDCGKRLDSLKRQAVIVSLALLLSVFSYYSIRFRRFLCGKPVILIENGKILQQNLKKTRLTLDELSEHLREKDISKLTDVKYAILETNGDLSVFPYPKECPANAKDAGIRVKPRYLPYTIVADGYLYQENLRLCGKDDRWLRKVLEEKETTVENTWLLTVDIGGRVHWQGKEI